MNSTEIITLKAFLIALAQQESPLPEDLQTQLKEISKNIPANLGKLNALGNKYLKDAYQEASDLLYCPTAERNKGPVGEIDERAERQKSEPSNMLETIDSKESDNKEEIQKSRLQKLLDIVKSWNDEILIKNAEDAAIAVNPREKILSSIESFGYPLF